MIVAMDAPRQTIRIGFLILACALPLLALPLLIGAKLGRFSAALGFVALCLGLSIILHGVIDRFRSR